MSTHTKPQGCTNLKLRQLGRIVTRHYDRYLSAVGLKNTQYAMLSHVVKLGPIRPSDLAGRMQIEASTLTRNLQPMVAKGWLTVGEGEDARSRLVVATLEGQQKHAQAQHAWKEAQLALNDLLGVERIWALHELMDSSIATLSHSARKPPSP